MIERAIALLTMHAFAVVCGEDGGELGPDDLLLVGGLGGALTRRGVDHCCHTLKHTAAHLLLGSEERERGG